MTCEECRFYISDANALGEKAAIEHLETCAECRRVAYAQEELGRCLSAVRDGAPEIPLSLDASIIRGYRREIDRWSVPARRNVLSHIAWAAMAAGIVLGAVLLMAHRRREVPAISATAKTAPSVTPVVKPPEQAARPTEQRPKTNVVRAHAQVHTRPKVTPVVRYASEPPDTGFQNLMYCDALSCSGAMQVIRIQVPVAAVGRVPAWHSANGLVQADVVVGSDGIARAIRIVR